MPSVDRKSTRLNSSHVKISYAVFCLYGYHSPVHSFPTRRSSDLSTASVIEMNELLQTKGARKVGPFFVPRNMTNTITANVGVAFKLQGVAHTITSACATSADAIG